MKDQKLGFIGVGQLAQPMVRHLLDRGHEVLVHNRRRDPLKDLVAKGAVFCDRPEDTVTEGGIVFNCLPDDDAVLSVFHPHSKIFGKMGKEGVHVSMATISPHASQIIEERHQKFGGAYCVATVMGRPDAVENKKQLYLLAGESAHVERVRPILDAIGSRTFTFGEEPHAANAAKLAFNFLIVSAIEAMAESFTFAAKNGVDVEQFYSTITETLLASPLYKNYGRALLDRSFTKPLFRLGLGAKDVDLICSTARRSLSPMRFASVLQDRMTASVAKGRENYDWTGIVVDVEEEAGMGS